MISRVVTLGLPSDVARAAGLNPQPRLKPSRIDWIGDIPQHWELRRLKDCGTLVPGSAFPHEFQGHVDEELPFYKVADLAVSPPKKKIVNSQHTISRHIAAELRARIVPPNSVLYPKIGAALFLNRRKITTVPCCIDNNMTAFVPDYRTLTRNWSFYWMSILDFGEHANPGAVPSLSEGYQSTLPLLVPSSAEQSAICEYLDLETNKINIMLSRVEGAIDRLREYRTALITAAVAGRVDLREAIPATEPAMLVAAG